MVSRTAGTRSAPHREKIPLIPNGPWMDLSGGKPRLVRAKMNLRRHAGRMAREALGFASSRCPSATESSARGAGLDVVEVPEPCAGPHVTHPEILIRIAAGVFDAVKALVVEHQDIVVLEQDF
jgi:hypothetical protein